jgi:hypothetical protein
VAAGVLPALVGPGGWPGGRAAAVDGWRLAAGASVAAGTAGTVAGVRWSAAGAVGHAGEEAEPADGHAMSATVAVPLASRNLAAVVVVTNERTATATPVAITASTGRSRR